MSIQLDSQATDTHSAPSMHEIARWTILILLMIHLRYFIVAMNSAVVVVVLVKYTCSIIKRFTTCHCSTHRATGPGRHVNICRL